MRLIDADALKIDYIYPSTTTGTLCYRYISKEQIDRAPTIEEESVRRGRWVIEPGIGCKCSACGFDIGNDFDLMEYVNYCPNCGADMRGEEV